MAEPDGGRRGRRRDRPRGRRLGPAAILAVAGAGLAVVAAALTWWSADYLDPLTGALTIAASGADCVPELVPLALVGLAGFGAALATRGVPRRVVGVVILLCGAGIAVRSGLFFGVQPAALVAELTRPADPVGAARLHPVGPFLGVLGGLLLAAGGVLITFGPGARQRMGPRYDRPADTTAGSTSSAAVVDPADWWKALDAGGDPTVESDPPSAAVDGPDRDGPNSTVRSTAESPPTVSEHTSGGGYHDPNASRPS